MAKRILKRYYVKAIRRLRYRKGYGVHSPFAYNLITKVIEESFMYYSYTEIEALRKERLHGQISQADLKMRRNISFRKGSLLFRLVNRFKPERILEIGSSWGISSLYLHAGNQSARHYCIEPHQRVYEISRGILQDSAPDVVLDNGELLSALTSYIRKNPSPEFIFIHRLDDPSHYPALWAILAPYLQENTVLVFESVHATGHTLAFWEKMIATPKITVSMDLYDMGIVFFDSKLHKQNYIVSF